MSDFPCCSAIAAHVRLAAVPENTFASFDLALEHGCDGFEFDVRLTGCGRAVVCHDPKVEASQSRGQLQISSLLSPSSRTSCGATVSGHFSILNLRFQAWSRSF